MGEERRKAGRREDKGRDRRKRKKMRTKEKGM